MNETVTVTLTDVPVASPAPTVSSIYQLIELPLVKSVCSDESLDPAAKFWAVVDHIRYALNLGPMLVYVRDADLQIMAHPGRPGYSLWHMSGVRVKAPMHGLIPRRVTEWLLAGKTMEVVRTTTEHEALGGQTARRGFWVREDVRGYVKAISPDESTVFVFNATGETHPITLADAARKEFVHLISNYLTPLLRQAIHLKLPPELFKQAVAFKETIERLHHLLLLGRARQAPEKLIPEILLSTYSVFASRGHQVLGTLLELIRDCDRDKDDGTATSPPELRLGRQQSIGVPSGMLGHVEPRSINPTADDKWAGITAWVAFNGTSLLVGDLEDRSSRDSRFDLLSWYQAAWPDVRAEIAVPIRDPESQRVYGVLNFESRMPRTFEPADVAWLEWLAQTAGAIMRQAAIGRLLTKLRPSSALIQSLRRGSDNIAREVGLFLQADDVVIQGRLPKTPARTVQQVSFWSVAQNQSKAQVPPPPARHDGYTDQIMTFEGRQPPYLFEIPDVGDRSRPAAPRIRGYAGDQDGDRDPWSVPWPGATLPVSGTARERGFATQVAVPLYDPREDPSRRDANKKEDKTITPIGVLWVSWGPWTADDRFYRPTGSDVRVIIEVAQGIAHIIDVHRGLDDPSATGVHHDLIGDVFGRAQTYAQSMLASPALGIMLEYFSRLPDLYHRRYAAPVPLSFETAVRRSPQTAYSVRRLLLSAVAIVTGQYAQYDSSDFQAAGLDAPEPDAADATRPAADEAWFGWHPLFEGVEGLCFTRNHDASYWTCMAILYNLIWNAEHEAAPHTSKWIAAGVGVRSPMPPLESSIPGNVWQHQVNSRAPQVNGIAVKKGTPWFWLVVENAYNGPKSTRELLQDISKNLGAPKRGLGLVEFLVTQTCGGWLRFKILADRPSGEQVDANRPDGNTVRRVQFEIGLPLASGTEVAAARDRGRRRRRWQTGDDPSDPTRVPPHRGRDAQADADPPFGRTPADDNGGDASADTAHVD